MGLGFWVLGFSGLGLLGVRVEGRGGVLGSSTRRFRSSIAEGSDF